MPNTPGTTNKGKGNEVLMDWKRNKYINSAVRPGVVLAIVTFTGYLIGESSDKPVEGIAAGIVSSALINGMIDHSLSQP